MRFVDPIARKNQLNKQTILFAGTQLQGKRPSQEDCFIHLNDECFVVADGVAGIPHGDTAARIAAETALWGYKHIRLRPFYWADKRLLLKRIFRSSNLTVWQKRRESGFESGLSTTLAVAIIGAQKIWVGSVGDTSIFLYREGLIDVLTPLDIDKNGELTNFLGIRRLGIIPHITVEKFLPGDIVLVATDGVINFISEDEMRTTFEVAGKTTDNITTAIVHLLRTAEEHGSDDNMTACMIKRLG